MSHGAAEEKKLTPKAHEGNRPALQAGRVDNPGSL
jgi:hypothetical protein